MENGIMFAETVAIKKSLNNYSLYSLEDAET